MTRAARPVKIVAYLLFCVTLVRLGFFKASGRDIDALSLWLLAASMALFWLLSWFEGVFLPLNFMRKGHEREFVILQILTGLAITGLGYLIASTF